MFGHRHARSRRDQGHGGGNIKQRRACAPRAAGVDDILRGVDGDHVAAHDGGGAVEFLDGRLARRQQ